MRQSKKEEVILKIMMRNETFIDWEETNIDYYRLGWEKCGGNKIHKWWTLGSDSYVVIDHFSNW